MKRTLLNNRRMRRARRVRAVLRGTAETPRISVFRSNRSFYAQLIDDTKGRTLAAAAASEVKDVKAKKLDTAGSVGKMMAEKAKKIGIASAVFDRGRYRYHGRVKAFAEAARQAGLKF